jgi:uncharacterized SAM-binding protein YcdF (DUF218 family)
MSVLNSRKRWTLLAVGGLLLTHCIYLVLLKVTHLGVIVPALIAFLMMLSPWLAEPFEIWLGKSRLRVSLWRLAKLGFVFWLLTLLVYFAVLLRSHDQVDAAFRPELIVILGASTPNAQPSPTLVERLKLGHKLALVSPEAMIVVSGGVDFRQTVSEAQVMKDYLLRLGLAESRIVMEDESTSTYENLLFTARKLQTLNVGQQARMMLVTSDFHTLRSELIAARVGWKEVISAGAITPLYMRYNAWIREYFACLSGWLLGEF